jgi:hypothetical protein
MGKKYFAGLENIPSLPILILVPRALSTQLVAEIGRYTKHGSYQAVVYSRNLQSRQAFFRSGGIWDETVTKSKAPHRTIIVAEFSVSASWLLGGAQATDIPFPYLTDRWEGS